MERSRATDEDAFDVVTQGSDPAMVVLTTVFEGYRAGCLVGFHAQAGIDPQRYCVWLSKANHTYRIALRASHFTVHFLTRQDLTIAEHFGTVSGGDVDKFLGVETEADERGVPLLTQCGQRILLDRITLLDDGSDHVCLTARVHSAQCLGPYEPLRLSDVEHLRPGREATERAVAPLDP